MMNPIPPWLSRARLAGESHRFGWCESQDWGVIGRQDSWTESGGFQQRKQGYVYIYIYIPRNSLYMGKWYGISGISNNCNDRNKHELNIWDGFVPKNVNTSPHPQHLGWALQRGQVLSFVSIHSDHQLSAKQAIFSQKCWDLQRFSMRFVAAL